MSVAEAVHPASSLPPRTRLYHLAPIGVGAPAVESLTGYLMRLAEAHCVPPSALVRDELLPVLRPEGLGGVPPSTWIGRFGAHFNGTGELARTAVAALAGLTGRQDLMALTLAPWSSVMASHGLRRGRAWCSACYSEALRQGTALYEPLLWAIGCIAVCPRHRTRLSERCPYADCGRRLPILAAHARPGHCSWCKRLLVHHHLGSDEPPMDSEEAQWNCWVADRIGAFLSVGPTFAAAPPLAGIGTALKAFIAAVGKGQAGPHGAFAQTVGISVNLIIQWRAEQTRPTLPMLLRMCRGLGVSLVQLVTGDTDALVGGEAKRSAAVPAPTKPPRQPSAILDMTYLSQEMNALDVSDAWPPLSGAAVARQLGCPAAVLHRHFPEQWRRLVMRYQSYRTIQREQHAQELAADIRQAMLQLDAQGLYPSSRRIRPLMHRRIHPRHAEFYVIRRQLLLELHWTVDLSARQQSIPTRREAAPLPSHPLSIQPICPTSSS